ncbi:uncharacterized protein LOC114274007 isoform X2 [Camellia sinensis]|uniref:uncharacterized protein LOC114274007 isoform X2 n=1 Tax=Camellia sinensis TaxID=4442 RepID=UPI0010361B95|nr:uncharacterized protein LOC114274007 isoform X2 [Camellia sinensis]
MLFFSSSSSSSSLSLPLPQKAYRRGRARVRDDGRKLHLRKRHCGPAPPLHKRASNRYWDIDQNTLQSREKSAISCKIRITGKNLSHARMEWGIRLAMDRT